MKLALDIFTIYDRIKNPPMQEGCSLDNDSGLVQIIDEDTRQVTSQIFNAAFNSPGMGANLPEPFVRGYFHIERRGNTYRGGVCLEVAEAPFYVASAWKDKIAPGLVKEYGNQYLSFQRGGLLLNKDGKTALIAIDAGKDVLSIFTGTEGIKRRPLTDNIAFGADMAAVEKVTNSVFSYVLGEFHPDLTLTLDI